MFILPSTTSLQTRTYTVPFDGSLGQILFLKVEKENGLFFIEDQWYCSKMVVTPPDGNPILFPCYRWISTGERVELRGGKGLPRIQKPLKFDCQNFLLIFF